MKDQDFPLYFSIIPDNGFNISALEFHGYKAVKYFFNGVKHWHGPFDWKGVYNSSVQSGTFHKTKVSYPTPICFLGIYNESMMFDSLDDILPFVLTSSCDGERCFNSYGNTNVNSLHILPYYPSVKFTFEFINMVKGKEISTIGIHIKPNISCKIFIEDKLRFARIIFFKFQWLFTILVLDLLEGLLGLH